MVWRPRKATRPPAVEHRHRNADWTNTHYRQLVDGLRARLTVEQLAEDLDRTPGAIRSRGKLLLPAGTPHARGQHAVDVLRELLLDDPDYPWESVLLAEGPGAAVLERRRHRAAAGRLEHRRTADGSG
ncbi:hypothetical protein ABZX12_04205 [Kribbella sp. NPDC003505]|uniref:hypothetical protein n=1 Tax=Kribbella sp. NPDC003505 TaxID=3154448 RepID=UPI0033B993B1